MHVHITKAGENGIGRVIEKRKALVFNGNNGTIEKSSTVTANQCVYWCGGLLNDRGIVTPAGGLARNDSDSPAEI